MIWISLLERKKEEEEKKTAIYIGKFSKREMRGAGWDSIPNVFLGSVIVLIGARVTWRKKKRGNVGFHGPQNNSNDVARPSFDAALKRFYKRKFKQMFLPYHHFRRSKVPGEGVRRVSRRLVGRGGRSRSRVSFRRQRFLRPPASKCWGSCTNFKSPSIRIPFIFLSVVSPLSVFFAL